MKFSATKLAGVWLIELERHEDERGYFARSWCAAEFARHGLNPQLAQCNVSFNRKKGTLRGLHYQVAPHAEAKLVRCSRGIIYDVAVDLRPDSPTYRQWVGFELSAENGRALYIAEGFAHGFQTRADESEVFYQMAASFEPASARGARWNDPAFGIEWPLPDPIISERDRAYANYPC